MVSGKLPVALFTVSYHLYVVVFSACAEDKAAAAMLTEPLSGRRDLVEGLDAEAILDYLTQHGVLDADTVQSLRSTDSMTQRNASLLQRVEEEGHNAVALFINALRQSGQLHLASSLDNTQRIKPMSGSGKKTLLYAHSLSTVEIFGYSLFGRSLSLILPLAIMAC